MPIRQGASTEEPRSVGKQFAPTPAPSPDWVKDSPFVKGWDLYRSIKAFPNISSDLSSLDLAGYDGSPTARIAAGTMDPRMGDAAQDPWAGAEDFFGFGSSEHAQACPAHAENPAEAETLDVGFAEIVALMRFSGGERAEASARLLRLERELEDPRCVAAGASSLVAHGLAIRHADGALSIGGPAAATAQTLGSATHWIQIDLVTPDHTDKVFSIEGTGYAILAQPRSQLSWLVMARNPDLTGAQAEFAVVKAHLDAHEHAGASLLNHGDPGHRLLVKRVEGAYTVGLLAADAAHAEREGPLDETDTIERIERFRMV